MLVGVIILVFAAISGFSGPQPATAQAGVQVSKDEAQIAFPDSITFNLVATSSSTVQKVFLDYGTNGSTCTEGTARQEVEFTAGKNINVSWKWDFHKSGNLPPGAQVWWQWELQDPTGASTLTDKQTLAITDGNYTWQSVTDKGVTVYWTQGAQSYGQKMLQIATNSLDQLSKNANIQPLDKVNLYIYPSFAALQKVVLFTPEWTGGVAFPEYGSIVFGDPGTSADWANQVIPHELTHLVTGQRVFNCVGASMPTWLNEGLSVYSEGPASQADLTSLDNAAKNGTLPSLDSLAAGFAANSDKARLNYAQSGETVRYLVTKYGADKIAALLSAIQSGDQIDTALNKVYGFDTDGLDALWRASVGYGPAPTAQSFTPTPTSVNTAVPTLALWTSAFGNTETTTTPAPTQVAEANLSATPAPSATSLPTEPAPTQPAAPTAAPASPLRCLGGSGFLIGLAALARWTALKRHL